MADRQAESVTGDQRFDIVRAVLDEKDSDRYSEADELLDRARANGDIILRVWRYRYALYRSRLASRRARRDEAAAFAMGTLWQIAEDQAGPLLPRHPDVGRVHTDQEVADELWRYAEAGAGESYDPLVDDYRDPDTGRVQWRWSLISRLRLNPDIPSRWQGENEMARDAAQPMLIELRAAGYPAYDLWDVAWDKLPSKSAARILIGWLERIEHPLVRSQIASLLCDPKARSIAAGPMVELFGELPSSAWEKDRVAAAVGILARDEQFEQVAAFARDPAHDPYRVYLFWAISYMKDPRAVDLCLKLLSDETVALAALRSLGDLRSERARPLLDQIAAEPVTRKRDDAAQTQRDRVASAKNGLKKLDKAVARKRDV